MFERNSTTINRESREVHAQLTLSDGETRAVRIIVPKAGDPGDFINRPEPFLKTATGDGQVTYVAKADIRAITPRNVPDDRQLDKASRTAETFDAYAILGVERNADQQAVHAAYQGKVKAYHPDRLAGLGLPPEMTAYAEAMLKRVNAAYAEIRSVQRAA